jgi:predicted amidophosphoribosyltransferase
LQGAKNLLFPVQCGGCGKWDSELCEDCRGTATKPIASKIIEDAAGYPTTELLCLGDYAGVLRSIILTAKHDRYRDYSDFLFEAGTHLGRAVGERLAAVAEQPMLTPLVDCPRPVLTRTQAAQS